MLTLGSKVRGGDHSCCAENKKDSEDDVRRITKYLRFGRKPLAPEITVNGEKRGDCEQPVHEWAERMSMNRLFEIAMDERGPACGEAASRARSVEKEHTWTGR